MEFEKLRTEEEIICIRAESSNLEDLNHIEELTVNITNYGDGGVDMHDIALLHKEFFRLGAYCFDYAVGQQLLVV